MQTGNSDVTRTMDEFSRQLQILWNIEYQLVEAMPTMFQKAVNLGVSKTLAFHYAETLQHKTAIEAICKSLGIDATIGGTDLDLQNMLKESNEKLANASEDQIDEFIVDVAIRIEELEMATYSMAGETAKALGYQGIAARLNLTFEEERTSRTKLMFLRKNIGLVKSELKETAVH